MGVLGELFPGPKIRHDGGETGEGERWRLGPIDLENDVVELHRSAPAADAPVDGDEPVDEEPGRG